ncbi:MAG: hypothetical protein KBD01_19875 [Acidobacteria bacterium]|nr:hypothetical protein [Acidobacteriota bacterium]
MAGSFVLQLDDTEIRRALVLLTKQTPFALARALTMVAKSGQGVLIERASKTFTLRGDWLTSPKRPGGIRIRPATKALLQSEIGTAATVAALAAVGDKKAAGKGGVQSVPTDEGKGSTVDPLRGPGELKALLRSTGLWPKGLLRSRKPFFLAQVGEFQGKERGVGGARKGGYTPDMVKTGGVSRKWAQHLQRHGDDSAKRRRRMSTKALVSAQPSKWIIFQRLTEKRYPIQAVYVFRREVKIDKTWPFEETIAAVVGERWPEAVEDSILETLWTAR